MGFKVGDKVRAKSWEEIEKTLDSDGYCHDMYFNGKMKEYCGETFRLEDSYCHDVFYGPEDWLWAEEWLELIESAKKKEKESVKMEEVVVVRGMNEQQVRKYLDSIAESIETIKMPRTITAICREISNKSLFINYHKHGDTIIAVTDDGKHIGVAHKHPDDTWNFNVGRALAKARALGWKDLEKELLAAL